MSRVIALIPARSGSKGIPGKNWRKLGRYTLIERAEQCAFAAGCDAVVLSTDATPLPETQEVGTLFGTVLVIPRPAELAQDDTPMLDVVKHALAQVPGEPDDIWLLVQPTQPLRKPEHLREAVRLLRETGADSVVSVVELPQTHSPDMVWCIHDGRLEGWLSWYDWLDASEDAPAPLARQMPTRRQDARPAFIRDGTVYAFRRATLDSGTIYGNRCVPLVIDPSDTAELDTEADWRALEARWGKR